MRICTKCGVPKSEDDFYCYGSRGRVRGSCRACDDGKNEARRRRALGALEALGVANTRPLTFFTRPTADALRMAVTTFYRIDPADLALPDRGRDVTEPRQVLCYLLATVGRLNWVSVGAYMQRHRSVAQLAAASICERMTRGAHSTVAPEYTIGEIVSTISGLHASGALERPSHPHVAMSMIHAKGDHSGQLQPHYHYRQSWERS